MADNFIVKISGQPGFHIIDSAGLSGIAPDSILWVATLDVESFTTVETSPGFADESDLSIDPHPAMFRGAPLPVDGFVYVLNTDEELASLEKSVTFSGTANTAYNGATVEGRMIDVNGVNLTGWQSLGTVTAGVYSGTITCPAVGPLAYKDVRIASADLMQRDFNRCRVGYAIDVAGRSQTSIPFQSWWRPTSSTAVEIGPEPLVADEERNLVSYLGIGGQNIGADGSTGDGKQVSEGGSAEGYHKYGLLGSVTSGPLRIDYHTITNIQKQWHRLSPNVGAVFIGNCHNSNLPMMDYGDVYDMLGLQAVSVAVGRYQDLDYPIPDPDESGTAEALAANNRARAESLPFGREGQIIVLTGNVKGQVNGRFTNSVSDTTVDFPLASQIMGGAGVVGPAMPGIRMEGAGGGSNPWPPHPTKNDYYGTLYEATMLPVAAARGLGIDTSKNPYFDAPMFNQDRTQITVQIVTENGGDIECLRPAQVSNFAVVTSGTPDWTGFSAVQSGNTVILSKTDTSTPWSAGAYVHMDSNGQSPLGDTALETRLLEGTIFETWEPDIYGRGLQACGTKDGSGRWVGELYEVPATWSNAEEEFPTKESLEAYLDPEAGNIGRTSTRPLKIPGSDTPPGGANYNPSTKVFTFPVAKEYVFEDWDLRGCALRIPNSGTAAILTVRQCLLDNGIMANAIGDGAVVHCGEGDIGVIENNDFIASGDFSNGEATKPIVLSTNSIGGGQGVVRKNNFVGWASDPLDMPAGVIERNRIVATSLMHFTPLDWSGATAYAVGDWVMYNGMTAQCLVANTGNPPTGVDGSSNTWWRTFNPHCDMITLRGTRADRPAIVQYNLIDRSFETLADGHLPVPINAALWYLPAQNTWNKTLTLRKNIIRNPPTDMGGTGLPNFVNSDVICEGNWITQYKGVYLSGSSGTWRWGYNYDYTSGSLTATPAGATAWP